MVDDPVERRRVLTRVLAGAVGRIAPPVVIGRYRLLDCLGRGGSGTVWSAHDDTMGRIVAIKRLHVGGPKSPSEQVLREARALARLSNPHVVQVFEIVWHEGDAYLVMQHVDGVPLHEWLTGAPPWRAVLAVLLDVGHGLAAAHARGLVHRDVKPANVLVTRDGRALVADFGIAEHRDEIADTIAGTPSYMAPEQRMHGPIDARADQYSYCVMALEALFDGESCGAPRALATALLRGASHEPRRRFATMGELLAALRRASVRRRTGLAAALSVLAIVPLCAAYRSEPTCEDASARLVDEWQDQRTQIRAQLREIEEPWFVESVDATLEQRVMALADAAVAACRADAEPRVRCLDERIDEQIALIRVLSEEMPTGRGYAMRVAEAMPGVERCDDSAVMPASEPPLEIANRVQAIRDRARRAEALELSGHGELALQEAMTALAEAEALGDARTETAARFGLGVRLGRSRRYVEAAVQLEQAYAQAMESGDDLFATKAALRLHHVHGASLGNVATGAGWGRQARALLQRIDNPPHLETELEGALGAIAAQAEDWNAAAVHAERACELLRTAGRADTLDHAWCTFNLATAQSQLGEHELGLETMLGVLAFEEERFGPDHLEIQATLNNISIAERHLGRYADAHAHLDRAFAIAERNFASDHPELGKLLTTKAQLALAEGDRTAAIRSLDDARAIYAAHANAVRVAWLDRELAALMDAT